MPGAGVVEGGIELVELGLGNVCHQSAPIGGQRARRPATGLPTSAVSIHGSPVVTAPDTQYTMSGGLTIRCRGDGGAPMDYEMISVDDHIDLSTCPATCADPAARPPPRSRPAGRRARRRDVGLDLRRRQQRRWAGGRRSTAKRSYQTALERAGLDEEGVLRPTEPELRFTDMKHDGIEATVMYGPAVALEIDDPELRLAVYRAYNDWLVEFCSYDPKRLIGVAMLPAEDAAGATAELGASPSEAGPSKSAMHIGRVDQPDLRRRVGAVLGRDRRERDHRLVPPRAHQAQILALNEALHRHLRDEQGVHQPVPRPARRPARPRRARTRPNARLVLAESRLGWPPWVVQEMDYRYARLVSMRDYWESQAGSG